MDAFGDGDDAAALPVAAFPDVGQELLNIKIDLRDIDEVRPAPSVRGQDGRGGQPARMTAHAFDDGDHARLIGLAVPGDFHDGGRDIFGCRGKAGAVVCLHQVIVNRLGAANDPALSASLAHKAGDLVAGIHGVVTAIVKEIADIIFLEKLQQAAVVLVILLRLGHFIPA